MPEELRLFAMFIGWAMALYGVQRRSWRGTFIAMTGLALADGAMTLGKGDDSA